MLLGIVSALLIAGAGLFVLFLLRIERGPLAAGLAPSVGVGVLAVVSVWAQHLRVPEPAVGVGLLVVCSCGLGLAFRKLLFQRRKMFVDRLTLVTLSAALGITVVVLLQSASVRAGVPNYVHDGAHHTETIEALRHGAPLAGFEWYPTGFHAPLAALLSLMPSIDSATGAVDWAAGLALLAPLALFGFATAISRDTRVGAASALLLSLTSTYPYSPDLYSVWPMAAGLLLVLGLWTTTLAYLYQSTLRWAVLGGLLASAVLLTHGTEVYTAAIGIVGLASLRWRVLATRRVAAHIAVAIAALLVLSAIYLPTLGAWAAGGGATRVGMDYFEARHDATTDDALNEVLFWSSAVSTGFVFDCPLRLALIGVGAWVASRRDMERMLFPLGLLFTLLVSLFRYVVADPMRALFALTLPWGVDDRLLMTVPLLAAPLGGLAIVAIAGRLSRRSRDASALPTGPRLRPGRRFAHQVLVMGLALGVASIFLVGEKLRIQTDHLVTYSEDDAAAMSWLQQHSQPGELLMNDGTADAGLWAPYKAGVTISLPRTRGGAPGGPEIVARANVAQLDSRADVRADMCLLNIRYVYHGAAGSPAESRQFPDLRELRTIRALEEIFSRGQAAIFKTRIDCAA